MFERENRTIPVYLRDEESRALVSAAKSLLLAGAVGGPDEVLAVADVDGPLARELAMRRLMHTGDTRSRARARLRALKRTDGRLLAAFWVPWSLVSEVLGEQLVLDSRAGLVGMPEHLVPTLLVVRGRVRVSAVDYARVEVLRAPTRNVPR